MRAFRLWLRDWLNEPWWFEAPEPPKYVPPPPPPPEPPKILPCKKHGDPRKTGSHKKSVVMR